MENDNYETKKMALETILNEFNAIRGELIHKLDIRYRIVSTMITTVTLVFGAIIIKAGTIKLLLLVPLIAAIFGFLWAIEEEAIHCLSGYLKFEIAERKIPKLIGDISQSNPEHYKNKWLGWEFFLDFLGEKDDESVRIDKNLKKYSWFVAHLIVFVGVSIFCILYYIFINRKIGGGVVLSKHEIIFISIDSILVILMWIRLWESMKKKENISRYVVASPRNK